MGKGKIFIYVVGLLIFSSLTPPASAFVNKNIYIHFKPLDLDYINKKVHLSVFGGIISYPEDWKVEKLERGVYKIRFKWWKKIYWKVDLNTKSFYGGRDGKERWNKSVKVMVSSEEEFSLIFPGVTIALNPERLNIQISTLGLVFSYGQDWKIEKKGSNLFILRHRHWKDLHWEVDANKKKVMVVTPEGEALITGLVSVGSPYSLDGRKIIASKVSKEVKTKVPPSRWKEERKKLYREVISKREYEILVVPFQVDGYAIDWTGRSLMTRYLCKWIHDAGASVAEPTLVIRALGERQRTYEDKEVFELANTLKVKTLIKPKAGYDEGMRFHLSFEIYRRNENGQLSPVSSVVKLLQWKNLKFSHRMPPSEVFLKLKDDIIKGILGIEYTPEKPKRRSIELNHLPESLEEVIKEATRSPLLSAYYLQFLGLLYPDDGGQSYEYEPLEREEFFERSLIALTEVSSKSRGYKLLKARAMFYLHRRPAALFSLKNPSLPEEHAFLDFLKGDILGMKRWIKEIESPLLKTMAEIEYIDLKSIYGYEIEDDIRYVEKDLEEDSFIGFLIKRRLYGKDRWYRQMNIKVKGELDRAFPLDEYTAEGLLKETIVFGDFDRLELSPYKHYEMYIKKNGKHLMAEQSWYPGFLDFLDILKGIAEANIVKRINVLLYSQGLPEEADSLLRKYEFYLMDNLRFTFARLSTLQFLEAEEKDPRVKENIEAEIKRLKRKICEWSQGQSLYSKGTCEFENDYNNDFPMRWNWPYNGKVPFISKDILPGWLTDRLKEDGRVLRRLSILQYRILYNNHSFRYIRELYWELKALRLHDLADRLLSIYIDHFGGSPGKTRFYAEAFELKGEYERAIKIYEEYLKVLHKEWWPYEAIGDIYLKTGQIDKAYETFMRYPYFNNLQHQNRVSLSNRAFKTGFKFMYLGEIERARKFFSISSSLRTGAASEMYSKAFLALFEKDLQEAASHFGALLVRYNEIMSGVVYAVIHKLSGYSDLADQVFKKIERENLNHPSFWKIAYLWHRVNGTPSEDILWWIKGLKGKRVMIAGAMRFLLKLYMIDLPPSERLPSLLDEVYSTLTGNVIGLSADHVNYLSVFAESYYKMKKGKFREGYNILTPYIKSFNVKNYGLYRFSFPYIAFMAAKSGKEKEFKKLIEEYRRSSGEDFYYHLSMAVIEENRTSHVDAQRHLKAAFYNLPFVMNDENPLSVWFQLVNISEMLYQMNGYEPFKISLLDFVKRYQRAFVLYGWAYAYEAKYTDSTEDRIRALAFTLLLDRDSYIIADIPEEYKVKAQEWLKKNNPFSYKVLYTSTSLKLRVRSIYLYHLVLSLPTSDPLLLRS